MAFNKWVSFGVFFFLFALLGGFSKNSYLGAGMKNGVFFVWICCFSGTKLPLGGKMQGFRKKHCGVFLETLRCF